MTSPFAAAPTPGPDQVRATVAAIAARDPDFNFDAFLAEAQQAFWLVGRANAECKPDLCTAVLSAPLATREQAIIEAACRNGAPLSPDDQDASNGQLVSIESDATNDTAIVHFTSTWRTGSGRPDKGDRRVQNWCFQRSAGSRTVKTSAGQRCQSCGAPLSTSAGTCRYCGATIGAGSGWRVIRVDNVGVQEQAEAVAAMRSLVIELARRRQPSSPPQQATAPARPSPGRRRPHPLRHFGFLVLVAAAVFVAYEGVAASGRPHRDVADVLPFFRHPILSGTLSLKGQITAQDVGATQVAPLVEFGGSCANQAIRTTWDFKAELPDGSTFDLQIALPPGQGGPATYRNPEVSASATNSSISDAWPVVNKCLRPDRVPQWWRGDRVFAFARQRLGGSSSLRPPGLDVQCGLRSPGRPRVFQAPGARRRRRR